MKIFPQIWCALLACVLVVNCDAAEWMSNYSEAMKTAESSGGMMFILFADESDSYGSQVEEWLTDPAIEEQAKDFTFVRLPLDYEATIGGKPVKILKHAAFASLGSRGGIAILDTSDEKSPQFRRVVTIYPKGFRERLNLERMQVILGLPTGTLAQRSLIMAVRFHPENPQSTAGEWSQMLTEEATSHSAHQARIRRQGHHNWESRFHSINAKLPGGLVSKEICAESWPNETMLQAAFECVRSWRQSSGHWSAVRQHHPFYGYDMKQGSNGIWYATGIFGGRY